MDPTEAEHALAAALLTLPAVRAVFVGGSRATGLADAASDTDLYALHAGPLPGADARAAALAPVADGGAVTEETAWGTEDHLHIGGHLVEIVYLDSAGLDLDVFYSPGVGPTGYTTAFLHTLAAGLVVADPHGELAAIRERLATYPEATRQRVLAQAPRELAQYVADLAKAQARADWPGVSDRRARFQELWFDLLFAVNRRYHPGEKRLLDHLLSCPARPADARHRWTRATLAPADDEALSGLLDALRRDLVALAGI